MSESVRVGMIGTSWWTDGMLLPNFKSHPRAEALAHKYGIFHKERNMITATLNNIQLAEGWEESDPTVRHKTAFPLFGAMGTETSLVICIELEPGYTLGRHTDSTEEVFLVLQGNVEIEVNGTRTQRSQGDMAVAPKLAPHSIRNIGNETARVLGFFGSANIISTFENIVMPEGMRVFDTAQFQ